MNPTIGPRGPKKQEKDTQLCIGQGRHNPKNSQGDSGGDVDKIFDLILYDFKDFGIFSKKVGGMHPPHPPPCDVHDVLQTFILMRLT